MPPEIQTEEVSLRDTLEEVSEQVEASSEEGAPGVVDTPAPAPAASTTTTETTPGTEVAAPAVPGTEAAPGEKPPMPPAPGPNDHLARPPGTWTPAAREHWASIPQAVREQVWKRDQEASRALTVSADARKFQNEFQQTITPYMGFIAAENSTPIRAVQNLMQTAATLRVGTAQQKVAVVAEVIKNFGIDLRMLDDVLAGEQPAPGSAPANETIIQQMVAKHMAPVLDIIRTNKESQERAVETEVDSELEAFKADPKHEFYEDVRDEMADLIELAARRGRVMGLTEAYERATLVSEPVRRVIEARKEQARAQQNQVIANKARRAAVSVPGSPEASSVVPQAGDSVRSAIEFALSKNSGS